jgi:release factor glutamine methyltransferase
MIATVDSAMNVGRALDWGTRMLAAGGLTTPRLDAEVLLGFITGRDRTWLLTWIDRKVEADHLHQYHEAIMRRARREPVAYITGRREFYDMMLAVTPDVLIPRAETELLVSGAIEWLGRHRRGQGRVLDVGTGSGAIALALAANVRGLEVVATDISEAALAVARQNAARHGIANVEFRRGDLFSALSTDERFDLILSNPPYVAESEFASLEPNVRDYEPRLALVAPRHGLAVIERLCSGSPQHLRPHGCLGIEIGAGQAASVRSLLDLAGFAEVRIQQDFAGLDRVGWGEFRGR